MPGQKMEAIRMGVPVPGSPAWDRGRVGKAALERKFDSDLSTKCSICFAPDSHLVSKLLFLSLKFEAYCFCCSLSVVATESKACVPVLSVTLRTVSHRGPVTCK